ncbi:cyd operon protein YbgE [Vibrio zhugei]|uniref:Cyd operon protein YbgE n=1 Tax=Vibrio zhugei TaxID=2479546 RepID=A0ABV7CE96_9VIBR|nr:cyd operon protein YbgE [Vibrio zhugei]
MNSHCSERVAKWHAPMDNWPLRLLSIVLGFIHIGLVMWNPVSYADHIGGFNMVKGVLLIWAVCSSVVYGIGFKPRHWIWQITFSPYFSLIILTVLTVVRFS